MKPTFFGVSTVVCWFCAAALVVTAGPVVESMSNETDRTSTTSPNSGQGSPSFVSCHEVRQIFAMKQIGSAQLVPSSQVNGESNELCPATTSCCNPKMEEKYAEAVKKDLGSMLQTASSYLKTLVATSATKFRKMFTDLLRNSENQTLAMISDGYKTMEPSVKGLVTEFYSNLTAYIDGGLDFDVEERVADFFDSLFPLVYHHVINPKLKDVGEDFKECLRETRDEIRPFGEVPQALATKLDRSLSLAKVFLQALSLGVEVINTTEHMDFGTECNKALVKLTYCPHCRGVVSAKPCGGYCFNVIRGCLAQVAELDRPWADFINALERMSSGFVRTYNLEEVTNKVHDEVNAAIMSASEMGPDLSKKVKLACGNPRRVARDVSSASKSDVTRKETDDKISNVTLSTISTPETTTPSLLKGVKNARAAGEEPLLQRLQSFARKLSESKSFFATLSDKLCSEDHLSTRSEQCWNGHEFAEYYKTIAGVGLSALKYNPEFRSAKNGTSTTLVPSLASPVPTLVDKLRHLKQVLNDKALSVPQGDSFIGEGSGSGSHNRLDDTDDEDLVDGSGSGDDADGDENRPKPTEDDLTFEEKNNRNKKAMGKKDGSSKAPSIGQNSLVLFFVVAFTSLSFYNHKSRILL